MLSIKNCSIFIDDTSICSDISLLMTPGSVHAIMGPNGSGKSTLVQTIAGHPLYTITSGSIEFNGVDIVSLSVHERAKRGIFVSFQQPPAIPGLSVFTLLKEMHQAITGNTMAAHAFRDLIFEYLSFLHMDHSFLERSCNEGFSGGEKKRFELLQLLVLQPQLIIFDEIDSGLDIDALQLVARVVERVKKDMPTCIVLIITHYQRLLEYIIPDNVHVLAQGSIVDSGNASLGSALEKKGYDGYQCTN